MSSKLFMQGTTRLSQSAKFLKIKFLKVFENLDSHKCGHYAPETRCKCLHRHAPFARNATVRIPMRMRGEHVPC
jgi:hypothetical protein